MRQKSTSHVICVDLMVQNNENKRIIPKNDGTFKLSSQFRRNLIDFAGAGGFGKRVNFAAELFNQRNCRRQFSHSRGELLPPHHKTLLPDSTRASFTRIESFYESSSPQIACRMSSSELFQTFVSAARSLMQIID